MSNYKHNTLSDRDALFGEGGGSKNKPERRKVSQKQGTSAPTPTPTPSSNANGSRSSHSTSAATAPATAKGYQPKKTRASSTNSTTGSSNSRSLLVGEARDAKIREAEDYRAKAKKAMQRGVFAKADPVAASMYYKRAADAYQMVGENRLERIHRVASADCQMNQGAYATAAADYTRAAQCLQDSDNNNNYTELSLEQKRQEGCKLHSDAANAFRQMGEMGKAAECTVSAALALLWGDQTTLLSKDALAKMEQAVEAHVPDPLNRYARYRQLGMSAFVDPDAESHLPTADMMALAKDHMVTRAYAHEPLHKLVQVFCHYGEYASALYAAGAATAILEADGISTRTLSKNYITETILFLAMGDPVAAERAFLDWHVQKTFYLTSRECKLAEELFRAVLSRDADALDEARSPTGSNRAALANVDETMRTLVQELRISGVARHRQQQQAPKASAARARKQVDEELQDLEQLDPSQVTAAAAAIPATRKTGGSESSSSDDDDGERMDPAALHAEMDDLMNDLGLEDDSDDGLDDDDDIDLR